MSLVKDNGKAFLALAWTNPEGSRRLGYIKVPVTFQERLSRPQCHSAAGSVMSVKNSDDDIGNRTRDLTARSAAPHSALSSHIGMPRIWRLFAIRRCILEDNIEVDDTQGVNSRSEFKCFRIFILEMNTECLKHSNCWQGTKCFRVPCVLSEKMCVCVWYVSENIEI
jgi:hypothetical protein